MSQKNPLTLASVQRIMRKRIGVPHTGAQSAIGKKARFTISGDGSQPFDVEDANGNAVTSSRPGQEGVVLQKVIFNLEASSHLSQSNTRNKGYLLAGIKAEKAGDTTGADEAFTKFLNATQMSFGVIVGSPVLDLLTNGTEIAGRVVKVDTEKGSLLTIDPSTISVIAPEVYEATEFNVEDYLGDEEEEEKTPAPKAKKAKA